jgi:hypothetical protein
MNLVIENYSIEKETGKGLYVSIPYWIPGGKKNELIKKDLKMWIPKAIIKDNKFANWVVVNELKKKRYIGKEELITKYFDQATKPTI